MRGGFAEAAAVFEALLRGRARKNLYLLLSVSYKKAEEFGESARVLRECLQKYPRYYQAYLYLGKLELKLKDYRAALASFEKALAIDPHNKIAQVGKGDALRLMDRFEEAKNCYSHALTRKHNPSLLLRRAICNMELKRLEASLEDIDRMLQLDPENSEALYFRGLIFNKQRRSNEAIICYEQAIKHNSNKRAVTRSLYEIAKIKIERREYYEALYTLDRAEFIDIDHRVIHKFKLFADGVTSMMKKNYSEGLAVLSKLLEDPEKPPSNFLKPLLFSTRAYGLMALERFAAAKEDLDLMEREFSLDLPNIYNKFVCEGILACNAQKYENALALFSKAGKALPCRAEPAFYKAVTLICFASRLIPKDMREKKREYLESAMKTIAKVEVPIESNPSLFMVRGFLHFAAGELEKAAEDLDCFLKDSLRPSALASYLSGLVLASERKFGEAIHMLSKAAELDERRELPEVFLNRAKCMLLVGEVNSGFVDLQSYMSFRPSSPEIHVWAGHLLFYIGAWEDAAKAYSNINNIQRNFEVLGFRARCHLTCKDVVSTIANLKLMLDLRYSNPVYFDLQLLEALRKCSEDPPCDYLKLLLTLKEAKKKTAMGASLFGELFGEADYQFYKGVLYFHGRKFPEAAKNFRRSLEIVEKELREQTDDELADFYKLTSSNRSYNYFEAAYNIAIAEVLSGQLPRASRLLETTLAETPEGETKKQFQLLLSLIKRSIKQEEVQEESLEIAPFPAENRLCSIFPEVILPLASQVRTRLFFCLPAARRPDITPRFEESLLESFDMAVIETKPEAPWIRRSEQGVVFTDEVIKEDIELSSEAQEGEETTENEEQNEEEDEDSRRDEDRSYEDNNQQLEVIDRTQLKEMLKLDTATMEKLARLQNRPQ